jgi:hypothetical protein
METTGAQWRVLVETTYVKPREVIPEPIVGAHMWVRDAAGNPVIVGVKEILPPEKDGQAGTIIAKFPNQ